MAVREIESLACDESDARRACVGRGAFPTSESKSVSAFKISRSPSNLSVKIADRRIASGCEIADRTGSLFVR